MSPWCVQLPCMFVQTCAGNQELILTSDCVFPCCLHPVWCSTRVTCVLQAGALRAALVCAMIMLIASPALVRDLADSANIVC